MLLKEKEQEEEQDEVEGEEGKVREEKKRDLGRLKRK
jgi:hypothetical protein